MIGPADVLGGISEHDRYNAVLERLLQDDLRQARIAVPTPDWNTAAAVPVNHELMARVETDPAKLAVTAISRIIIPMMHREGQPQLLEAFRQVCLILGGEEHNYGSYDLISRAATAVRNYPDPLEAQLALGQVIDKKVDPEQAALHEQALKTMYGQRYAHLETQCYVLASILTPDYPS